MNKKIIIGSIIGSIIMLGISGIFIYDKYFALTPKEKEQKEVISKFNDGIDIMYKRDTTQKDIKEYAIDYKVATEFLNFSSRNYVNIFVEDDSETSKIKLPRKKELVQFYDEHMEALLKYCKENNNVDIFDIKKQKKGYDDKEESYFIEVELESYDMNAYYNYVANFVLMFLSKDGNGGYDTGVDGEKGRVRIMEDVYIAKALCAKLLENRLDDFIIKDRTKYTIQMVEKNGTWKIDNLNNLQFALNGGYSKKYLTQTVDDTLRETQENIMRMWDKAIKQGLIDKSDIRNIDNILE